ncbi:hypothetical protein FKM82_019656 [Ascaphus truei]
MNHAGASRKYNLSALCASSAGRLTGQILSLAISISVLHCKSLQSVSAPSVGLSRSGSGTIFKPPPTIYNCS